MPVRAWVEFARRPRPRAPLDRGRGHAGTTAARARVGKRRAPLAVVAVGGALALPVAAPPAVSQTLRRDPVDAGGPLDILSARLRQLGQELVLSVRTAGEREPGHPPRGGGGAPFPPGAP